MEKKLYVGCGLTHAPEEFRDSVDRFKDALRESGHTVLDFLGLVAGTPGDVYRHDIKVNVASCDILVGICDEPSIGLGMEIGTAIGLGKQVLLAAQDECAITRIVPGAAEEELNVHFARYTDLLDVVPMVNELAEQS
ncbi:MAG TPA: hypothetical protein VJ843_05700 [Candidatus Saccharimonadales bacterium]|nr:hypothetical protein [Candidatus Saccharimonadales bacterium]